MTDQREGLRFVYRGGKGRLFLDGHDISRSVARVEITADAVRLGWVPEIVLHPSVHTVETTALGSHERSFLTRIDDDTRKLLIRIGWTPPADDSGSDVTHTEPHQEPQKEVSRVHFGGIFPGREIAEPFGNLFRTDNESPDAND